jgi:murein DD-endopeptidase MepM/ murein hydrolase activator NlpD
MKRAKGMRLLGALAFNAALAITTATASDFSYRSPGQLMPSNSGQGNANDRRIYAPQIGIPMKLDPGQYMFANSQVWRKGGSQGGDQCDSANYSMPWVDDFCEKRSRLTPLCPTGMGHQGVDVRPPICRPKASVDAIAVSDGTIIGVNPYTSSVTLKERQSGTVFLYLHLEPPTIRVAVGNKVKQGDSLGRISNFMNGKPQTTVHLHFEIKQNISVDGKVTYVNVPPYASLVNAHRAWLGLPDMNDKGILKKDPQREL